MFYIIIISRQQRLKPFFEEYNMPLMTNSGDLVVITNNETQKQVFTGNLLGLNNKIIIGIEQPYLAKPESHIVSNFEQIKQFSKNDIEDNLDCWLDAENVYPSFDAKTHTVTVIKANETEFKADVCNEVYNFKSNKWGEKRHGRFGRTSCVTDNPIKPTEAVIIECIGGENLYMIINGIQCAVKAPNINQFQYPYTDLCIGMFDLVADPNNPDMLNAVLIKSYDAEYKANILN